MVIQKLPTSTLIALSLCFFYPGVNSHAQSQPTITNIDEAHALIYLHKTDTWQYFVKNKSGHWSQVDPKYDENINPETVVPAGSYLAVAVVTNPLLYDLQRGETKLESADSLENLQALVSAFSGFSLTALEVSASDETTQGLTFLANREIMDRGIESDLLQLNIEPNVAPHANVEDLKNQTLDQLKKLYENLQNWQQPFFNHLKSKRDSAAGYQPVKAALESYVGEVATAKSEILTHVRQIESGAIEIPSNFPTSLYPKSLRNCGDTIDESLQTEFETRLKIVKEFEFKPVFFPKTIKSMKELIGTPLTVLSSYSGRRLYNPEIQNRIDAMRTAFQREYEKQKKNSPSGFSLEHQLIKDIVKALIDLGQGFDHLFAPLGGAGLHTATWVWSSAKPNWILLFDGYLEYHELISQRGPKVKEIAKAWKDAAPERDNMLRFYARYKKLVDPTSPRFQGKPILRLRDPYRSRFSKKTTGSFKMQKKSDFEDKAIKALLPVDKEKKFHLISPWHNLVDVGYALTFSDVVQPTWQAVDPPEAMGEAELTQKFITRTEEERRSAQAVLINFHLWDFNRKGERKTWTAGLEMGFGLDDGESAFFAGATLTLYRFLRLGVGNSWQKIKVLRPGQTEAVFNPDGSLANMATPVAETGDIRLKDVFENDMYYSLTISITDLPFFNPQ